MVGQALISFLEKYFKNPFKVYTFDLGIELCNYREQIYVL